MKLAYSLCLTVSVLTLAVNNCAVASPLDTSHIHTQHTLGLKPISSLEDSYNLAAAVFLPDFEDSIGFGGNTLDDDVARRDNCSGFALASCPAHAKCSKCTFDTKYKITSCDTDYKQSGNTCIAKTCSEINGGYKADVPTNQICNITNTSVRTCYSSCRAVNTSGYPLDTCPSGAKCTTAPDCVTSATTKGNCSPVKQKVTGCTSSTQKVNSTATACIDKDDTCPTNYYKSCATGTQGDPKYTERGSACYQCKPKETLGKAGDILYSDMTTSSTLTVGKTPIAVVYEPQRKLAVALSGTKKAWSIGYFDIPGVFNRHYENAINLWNGKQETKDAVDFCRSNSKNCPAVEYSSQYKTANTKAGDWYLPALSDFLIIYQNADAINNSLNLVKGTPLPKDYHWSVSVYLGSAAWSVDLGKSNLNHFQAYDKQKAYYIRPVINYGS